MKEYICDKCQKLIKPISCYTFTCDQDIMMNFDREFDLCVQCKCLLVKWLREHK